MAATSTRRSGLMIRSTRSERTVAGATQLTRTPYCPTSSATWRVSITMPALAAAYDAVSFMSRKRPALEAMVTIAPRRRSIMPGRKDLMVRNVAPRLESMTESHSSSLVSCTGVKLAKPPANATRMSAGPSCSST